MLKRERLASINPALIDMYEHALTIKGIDPTAAALLVLTNVLAKRGAVHIELGFDGELSIDGSIEAAVSKVK